MSKTQGDTLTLREIPGFSLDTSAGSATFPGESKTGLVSITQVHADKVPMVPQIGQQPRFIVTIQPPDVQFDPPAPISFPNVDGRKPGEIVEIFSFDHDMGMFVSIGTGMVTEDGLLVRSDPGVGIIKGGWHYVAPVSGGCSGAASGTGCPPPPECKTVQATQNGCGVSCTLKNKPLCDTCKPAGRACDGEGTCLTGPALIPKICGQLGLTYANEREITCPFLTCGAGISYDVTKVTHSCDAVDLAGARVTEKVTNDHGCFDIDVEGGRGCPIGAGNTLTGCTDRYQACDLFFRFPIGTCTETIAQELYVGSCLAETRTIKFTITKTLLSCTGTAVRN